jgi:hypothetical protein
MEVYEVIKELPCPPEKIADTVLMKRFNALRKVKFYLRKFPFEARFQYVVVKYVVCETGDWEYVESVRADEIEV